MPRTSLRFFLLPIVAVVGIATGWSQQPTGFLSENPEIHGVALQRVAYVGDESELRTPYLKWPDAAGDLTASAGALIPLRKLDKRYQRKSFWIADVTFPLNHEIEAWVGFWDEEAGEFDPATTITLTNKSVPYQRERTIYIAHDNGATTPELHRLGLADEMQEKLHLSSSSWDGFLRAAFWSSPEPQLLQYTLETTRQPAEFHLGVGELWLNETEAARSLHHLTTEPHPFQHRFHLVRSIHPDKPRLHLEFIIINPDDLNKKRSDSYAALYYITDEPITRESLESQWPKLRYELDEEMFFSDPFVMIGLNINDLAGFVELPSHTTPMLERHAKMAEGINTILIEQIGPSVGQRYPLHLEAESHAIWVRLNRSPELDPLALGVSILNDEPDLARKLIWQIDEHDDSQSEATEDLPDLDDWTALLKYDQEKWDTALEGSDGNSPKRAPLLFISLDESGSASDSPAFVPHEFEKLTSAGYILGYDLHWCRWLDQALARAFPPDGHYLHGGALTQGEREIRRMMSPETWTRPAVGEDIYYLLSKARRERFYLKEHVTSPSHSAEYSKSITIGGLPMTGKSEVRSWRPNLENVRGQATVWVGKVAYPCLVVAEKWQDREVLSFYNYTVPATRLVRMEDAATGEVIREMVPDSKRPYGVGR